MVSRIMLSLKKAADSQQKGWSLAEPTVNDTNYRSMKFFRPANGANEKKDDDIPLDTVLEA
jgi:hypothetical protein